MILQTFAPTDTVKKAEEALLHTKANGHPNATFDLENYAIVEDE